MPRRYEVKDALAADGVRTRDAGRDRVLRGRRRTGRILLAAAVLLFLKGGGGAALADPVVLKSGARGEMSFSVSTAPERFGGPSAGNRLDLIVALDGRHTGNAARDARSLCQIHARAAYRALQAQSTPVRLPDPAAPLVAVRVIFRYSAGAVSVDRARDFDMRGIVKCKPPD